MEPPMTTRRTASPCLSTPRLTLRLPDAADLAALHVVFGDPAVMRFVGAGVALSREQLAASQSRVAEHWRRHGFGPFTCVERSTGAVVGEAGLQHIEDGAGIELTYTFARAVWGRGYATEAARAVLDWGFGPLHLERIMAVARPENLASQHVLHKLGMRAEEDLRVCYGDKLACWGIGAAEWRRTQSPVRSVAAVWRPSGAAPSPAADDDTGSPAADDGGAPPPAADDGTPPPRL
jgi:RimJ/RimL family protein N-acetyltransferase